MYEIKLKCGFVQQGCTSEHNTVSYSSGPIQTLLWVWWGWFFSSDSPAKMLAGKKGFIWWVSYCITPLVMTLMYLKSSETEWIEELFVNRYDGNLLSSLLSKHNESGSQDFQSFYQGRNVEKTITISPSVQNEEVSLVHKLYNLNCSRKPERTEQAQHPPLSSLILIQEKLCSEQTLKATYWVPWLLTFSVLLHPSAPVFYCFLTAFDHVVFPPMGYMWVL